MANVSGRNFVYGVGVVVLTACVIAAFANDRCNADVTQAWDGIKDFFTGIGRFIRDAVTWAHTNTSKN